MRIYPAMSTITSKQAETCQEKTEHNLKMNIKQQAKLVAKLSWAETCTKF